MQQASDYLHHQGAKGLPDLAELMQQSASEWARCLDGIGEVQASFQPNPDDKAIQTPVSGEGPKWCVKEVIGHFLESDGSLNNTVAAQAGVPSPHGPGPAVNRMGWQSPELEALSLDELKSRLSSFFDATCSLIATLESVADLDATFPHPAFGPLNAKEWMAFHRLHSMDHIRQIQNIKADPAYPGV
jgi:hypothetical protein